jgi:hypothetical protein
VGVLYILQVAEVVLAPAVPVVLAEEEQDNEEQPELREQHSRGEGAVAAQLPVVTVVVQVSSYSVILIVMQQPQLLQAAQQ